jgi:hypothetical protein
MKYGIVLPCGTARDAADIAYEAEQAGWDGFFVYETVWGTDAWVSLAAAAMRTTRIKLGTDLTPVSRMRPWKLASETATLDDLSDGRLILSVGLGAPETGFAAFGEVTDRKIRAELLDEGLDILNGLWAGQPFSYHGKHYHIEPCDFTGPPPPPKQKPRIPIWVAGMWPRPKSMRRVLRCDGILPDACDENGVRRPLTPEDLRAISAFVAENRTLTTPFDVVMEGETPTNDPDEAREITRKWAEAGATWWIESRWNLPRDATGLAEFRERVLSGPPRH